MGRPRCQALEMAPSSRNDHENATQITQTVSMVAGMLFFGQTSYFLDKPARPWVVRSHHFSKAALPPKLPSNSLGLGGKTRIRCVTAAFVSSGHPCRIGFDCFVPIPDLSRCSKLRRAYSMTSSAVASSVGGTVRPSALAVLRLIASSNFVGCTTGKSAGFSPFKMRPA